mgnify:FL=1
MKSIKSIMAAIIALIMIFALTVPVMADEIIGETVESVTVEYLEDGSYYETVITVDDTVSGDSGIMSTTKTRTGSKKTSYKNKSGDVLWYVKVTGKFTYNDSTSKCTSASATAASNSSSWKITDKSSSKSGNKAIGKATAKEQSTSLTRTVTLSCSKTGKLS